MTYRAVATLGALEATGPVEAALDWINAHYREYMGIGPKILDLRHRAAVVQYHAKEAGDSARQEAARIVGAALMGLYDRWTWTADQLEKVAGAVPGLGQWVVPVLLGSVAVVAASVGAVVIADYHRSERVLDLLEAGDLSVEQARTLGLDVSGHPFLSFSAGAWSTIAAAGFAWWWARKKRNG